MSRFHSYISSAVNIIDAYNGESPFSFHLKKYFSANKKFGSKDRKTVATLCYCYFRAGHVLDNKNKEAQILYALFLCETKRGPLLENLHPELNNMVTAPIEEKLSFLNIQDSTIFPFINELSDEVKCISFYHSFFIQPSLFLRIRPGKKETVFNKLSGASIEYSLQNEDCIELENSISLQDIIKLNKEAVVQDASSQQVFNYFDNQPVFSLSPKTAAWDCCVASGGKSILLFDKLQGKVQLTVSDIRENILFNCKKRLQQAGVNIYKSFMTDLTKTTTKEDQEKFSIIICDVPCSGSGTWARTPEQLLYFKQTKIAEYTARQKAIAVNALLQLAEGGLFFYITCSVFTKENEAVAEYIREEKNIKLLAMQYIKGFQNRADTMFVAVFTR